MFINSLPCYLIYTLHTCINIYIYIYVNVYIYILYIYNIYYINFIYIYIYILFIYRISYRAIKAIKAIAELVRESELYSLVVD